MLMFFSIITVYAVPGPDDLVVFANKSVKTPELTMKQLEQIYLGKLTAWPDKSGKVKAYNMNMDSKERTAFQKIVLKKTPDEMKKYWVKKRIEGKERPPQAKKSAVMVSVMVSKFKGGIGYCFYKDLKDSLKAKLHIIKINGKEILK
jgi:ABC-type phosphate transport system substrate-binding protein